MVADVRYHIIPFPEHLRILAMSGFNSDFVLVVDCLLLVLLSWVYLSCIYYSWRGAVTPVRRGLNGIRAALGKN